MLLTKTLPRGAGSDTTAIALTAWMYLLLTNETAYEKLVAEVRGTFKSHEDINWTGVKNLPYLGACINETLRMMPPAPGNFTRMVPPDGGSINGRWVPGKVSRMI
jgi:cytochrome P450